MNEILKIKGNRMYVIVLAVFSSLILCSGCRQRDVNHTDNRVNPVVTHTQEIKFAERFTIEYFDEYKRISVLDPWQGAEDIVIQYYLVPHHVVPDNLPADARVIKVPIRRIICTSTTHIGMLDYLGKLNTLVGISGRQYVNNPWVIEQVKENNIIDIGYDQNINYEQVIALQPDLVMTYGVGSEIASYIGKLNDLDIPVIINGDYLEQSPLAKSEWIKVVAALYDMDNEVTLKFNNLILEYQQAKDLVSEVLYRPKVMIGLPWKDTWYIPGANSFAANFIIDAGGSYIWEDKHTVEAIPFNIEAVYEQARNADIWINPGTAGSISEIIDIDERLSGFKPVNQNRIYNNNRIVNTSGGNDYWESGIMNPHKILMDLIKIFHPEIIPEYQLVYYIKIDLNK